MLLWTELLHSVPLPTASLFPTKKGIANGSRKNSLDTISIQIYNPTNFSAKIMFPSRCELREWPVTSTKLVSGLLALWLFLASFGLTFVGPLPRVAWDEDGEIRAFLLKCF